MAAPTVRRIVLALITFPNGLCAVLLEFSALRQTFVEPEASGA
jgi:hypothetical protein